MPLLSSSAPKIAPHAKSNGGEPIKSRMNPPNSKAQDLSLCVGLVSMFDFDEKGSVTRDDWKRGMKGLNMEELGEDGGLWRRMLEMHAGKGDGYIELERVRDVVPIDPRVSVLLTAIVHGLVGVREFAESATRKMQKEVASKSHGAIIRMRRKIMEPVLRAWRDYVKSN
eukprot:5220867-Prymnesium_polylepis.1